VLKVPLNFNQSIITSKMVTLANMTVSDCVSLSPKGGEPARLPL